MLAPSFYGHCPAEELVKHFYEMTEQLELDGMHLIHLGMDGPKVNLKFEKDLCAALHAREDTVILNLGTCSLHPVHTAFKKGLEELQFAFGSFFNALSFFFKLSAARRNDYSGELENLYGRGCKQARCRKTLKFCRLRGRR